MILNFYKLGLGAKRASEANPHFIRHGVVAIMDISILIPVYNVEKYLEQCLKSIPHNNLGMELICLNDGSSDNSLSIIESAARDDKRIVVINKQNEGYWSVSQSRDTRSSRAIYRDN